MRILLNATDGPLSVRAVRRYILELARGLGHEDSGVELHLAFFTHRILEVHRFLKLVDRPAIKTHVIPVPRRILNARHRKPTWEIRRLMRNVDLYHETTHDSPAVDGEVPVLMTVHGMCPFARPDLLGAEFSAAKQQEYRRSVRESDHFAPVSESTGRELQEFLSIPEDRIHPVPLGISEQFRQDDPRRAAEIVEKEFGITGEYVLYVGGIQENKNIPFLLDVFSALCTRGDFDGNLVLTGDNHYAPEHFQSLLTERGIEERVHCTGCLTPEDERLSRLYQAARLFLFPSFYEGWTSPPLESMACGTPVIASNLSSLPETVGDGGLLLPPGDPDLWAGAAAEILNDPAVREPLIASGLERAALFPWSRCVERTTEVYRSLLGAGAASPAPLVEQVSS